MARHAAIPARIGVMSDHAITGRESWGRCLLLLLLPLLGGIAVIVLVWAGSGGDGDSVTVADYPTPRPVTFIPPTPKPATPRPTLAPPPEGVMDQPVPDFTLPMLDGESVHLPDLAGEIVILNFWATWCVPCREEMPLLQAVQDSGDARVIAVTDPDDGQSVEAIEAFLAEYDLDLTVALATDPAILNHFEVTQIPVTYWIDRAGVVRFRHVGALHDHDVADYLAALGE
ncbi:MAG: redoxin domain-containing protein [Anaerolineae bacterium]|nr:redoxin domain-containing protein [Anaerolineae bacterium]